MKRTLLLAIALTATTWAVKAQTTQQEYNYCRNTYAKSTEAGYNILTGYKAVNYYKETKEDNPVKVVLFNKANDKTQAIMIIVKSAKVPLSTIVIPIGNDDLWDQTISDFRKLSSTDKGLSDSASLYAFMVASNLLQRLDTKDGLK